MRIHCFVFRAPVAVFLVASVPVLGQAPVITDLGVLPACTRSRAGAVSADGTSAAGFCWNSVSVPRAFRWTAAQGMADLGLLPGWLSAEALGLSGDGSVVAGYLGPYLYPSGQAAFRWTPGSGMQQLGPIPSVARAVSRDGSTIVGSANGQAARWTAAGLELLAAGTTAASHASDDGGVIVGSGSNAQAFRWTAAGGVQYLGTLPGASYSYATAVSGDGSVVVGVSGTPFMSWPAGSIFRWTAGGMQNLGGGGGPTTSTPTGLNADGSIIVGYSELDFSVQRPLIWTAELGMRDARAVLPTMGVTLTSWEIRQLNGISPDGSAIAGWGTHNGFERAFVISGLPPEICLANCDGSSTPPILNINDFACFLGKFAEGSGYPPFSQFSHYANCDGSGTEPVLNVNDFFCFINLFAAGCD